MPSGTIAHWYACGMLAASTASAVGQISTLASPGAKPGGAFGTAVAGVPDVNGDGLGDIVVGANAEGLGTSSEGHAYIYSGANGALLRILLSPHPEPDGEFGECVAGVPDVNGDGRGDVVIGAPEEDPGLLPNDAGKVYVFSGDSGNLLFELQSPTPEIDGEFGGTVAGVPDTNGDGRGDILVGSPNADPGASPENAGRAYLYSGATGALLRILFTPFPEIGGQFGCSVAGVADVNGDGRGDLIVGARFEDPGISPTDCGRVHLFSGATGLRLRTLASPNGQEIDGRFGHSVAGIPDADGDGRGDVVVGAPREDPGTAPQDSGRAYIYSGATGTLLRKLFTPVPEVGGQFGVCVAGLVDTNDDGRGDVAVGAWQEDPGLSPAECGRVHLYSGATGLRIATYASAVQSPGGRFGVAVAGVTKADGNLRGDFVVGAEGEASGAGRAYVLRR